MRSKNWTVCGVITAACCISPAPGWTCNWDCGGNNDGRADLVDLLVLIQEWGAASSCDFDGQGVGASDLIELVAHWGECEPAPLGGGLPPDCSGAFATPSELWPPNHKFRGVTIGGVFDPDGGPVGIFIMAILQDEPVNGDGDGNTCPDGGGLTTSTAQIRSERSGLGDGRVYHIAFTAMDDEGDTCDGAVTVCVPHDQGLGDICVDQGLLFDSTVCP
jgi:hypothetical protein